MKRTIEGSKTMENSHFKRDLETNIKKVSRDLQICAYYFKNGCNVSKTAEILGISRVTVKKVIDECVDLETGAYIFDLEKIGFTKNIQ